MQIKIMQVIALFLSFSILCSPALSSDLSRKWEHHFWIHEHTDMNLQVFHLPNGTIRARGRFSNGLQSVDRTISVLVLVETDKGEIWHMTITERVPMTKLGGTQIRWKEQDMAIGGNVVEVRAKASIVDSGQSFGVKFKCEVGGCKLDSVTFKDKPDKVYKTSSILTEKETVNICAGFQPRSWRINETGYWTKCDPQSGIISEHSRFLDRPIPRCDGCAID